MNKLQSIPPKKVRSKCVTQEKIDKRIVAGDGLGVREEYVPWIKIRSFPSCGTSHIVPGVKVRRAHHLLSNAEYHYHVILEHDRSVIDIREQFPLHPSSETHAIATSLGIRPPVYPGTNVPLVFTTDFLITQSNGVGKEKLVARSMKYLKEIESASPVEQNRILEKLAIERQYWERRNIEWKLVFYENLSQTRIKNLLTLRSYALIAGSLGCEKNISLILELISTAKADKVPLKVFLLGLSRAMYMEYKSVKRLFFHLVWLGAIEVDLASGAIDLSQPLKITNVSLDSQFRDEVSRHA